MIKVEKRLIISIVAVLVLFTSIITILCICNSSSFDKATKMVEKDMGKKIDVIEAYYSEKLNYYFLIFESDDEEDIACVKLDKREIGYASVYYGEKSLYERYKDSMTREQLQNFTKEKWDYPYDAVCEMNIKYGIGDWIEVEIK